MSFLTPVFFTNQLQLGLDSRPKAVSHLVLYLPRKSTFIWPRGDLKRQSHEIFDLHFFHKSMALGPDKHPKIFSNSV
jgi:hypothetical protein